MSTNNKNMLISKEGYFMDQKAVSQPISFWPDDLDFLRRKAQRTGQSLSSLVRMYVRADRAACDDLHDNGHTPTPDNEKKELAK